MKLKTNQTSQDSHNHNYTLAKYADNLDELKPQSLYAQATSKYIWMGVALYICECGEYKEVHYGGKADD